MKKESTKRARDKLITKSNEIELEKSQRKDCQFKEIVATSYGEKMELFFAP